MKFKLLVLDVDDVLIKSSRRAYPTKNVINAIKKAKNKIKISLCTGRAYPDLKYLINLLNLNNFYHVTESGTKVVNPQGKEEYAKYLNFNNVEEIVKAGGKLPTGYGFCVNGVWFDKLKDVNNKNNITITCLHSSAKNQTEQIVKKLQPITGKYRIHVGSRWDVPDGAYIHVTQIDASKEVGLKHIQKKLNILKKETIGVGDGLNDLPIFNVSELKIAMGNGKEELKKLADYIAPSLKNDGVVNVIEKFILN